MNATPPGSSHPGESGDSTPRIEWLRRWSRRLDSVFRIPGTTIRFGWDPIVGLLAGVGDVVTPVFSALVLVQAFRLRVPRTVLLRMIGNLLVDLACGTIPMVGDLFDVTWKANVRNVQLLEHHARPGERPGLGDWLFLGLLLAVIVIAAIAPVVIVVAMTKAYGLM